MQFKHRIYHLVSSLLLINLSFGIANFLHLDTFWVDGWAYPSLFVIVNTGFILSYYIAHQHKIQGNINYFQVIGNHLELFFYFLFIVLLYWFFIDSDKYFNTHISLFLFLAFVFTISYNFVVVHRLRKLNIISDFSQIIIIGNSPYTKSFESFVLNHKWLGYSSLGTYSSIPFESLNSNISNLFINIQDIFLSEDLYLQLKNFSEKHLFKVKGFAPYLYNKVPGFTNKIGEFYFIDFFTVPLDQTANQIIKRLFDIFMACLTMILVFSWLFPIIACLIKLTSRGPVFYKQARNGIDGKVFFCYKFRSMKTEKNDKFIQATQNDRRVTPIGRYLRKTNIDELPQIFNVIMGDMSIVGPRPHAVQHNNEFENLIESYNSRHKVKPGITGLAQVMGFRGETDTIDKMEGRVRYDRFYLYNWSFWLDIKIIFLTIRNMILGDKNAY